MATLAKLVVELVGDVSGFSKDMEGAGSIVKRATDGMMSAGTKLTAGLTAPIMGIGVAALAVGAQYDDAMDTIAIATGATGTELEGLGDTAMEVFTSIPTSMDIAAQAIGELNQRTGQTGEGLRDLSMASIELARLTGGDLTSQIANTTRMFGDWGVEVEDQVPRLDMLLRASQASGLGVDTLAGKLVQFGAPLRQMGFTLEESTALLAKFEVEGVNTELVLGSMRIALGKFAKAGIEPVEGLQMLISEIQGAGSVAEANELAMAAFGARAGPDMAAAIREGRFEIADFMDVIANGEGTIMGTAESTADFAERMTLLKNKVVDAARPLGEMLFQAINDLMPVFERIIGFVAGLIGAFGNLPQPVQTAVLVFFGILAAIGPVLVIFAQVITAVGAIGGALAGLGGVLGTVAAVISGAFLPILAIIAVVIGAVLLLKLAWENNFLGIRDIAQGVWDSIKAIFSFIKDTIENFLAFLRGELTWDEFVENVKAKFSILKNYLLNIWINIVRDVAEKWEEIKQTVINKIAEFIAPLVGGMDNARQIITTAWENVTTFLGNTWETIKTAAAAAWEFLKGVVEGAVEFIRGVIAAAMQILSGDWSGAWETIKETVTRVWDEIKAGISSALEVIGPAVTTAWENIKTGVTERAEAIKAAVSEKWDAIKTAAGEKWEAVKGRIETIVGGIKTFVVDTLGEVVEKAIELFGRIISAITGGGGGGDAPALSLDLSGMIRSLQEVRAEWTLTKDHVTEVLEQMTATLTEKMQAMLSVASMGVTGIHETVTATYYLLEAAVRVILETMRISLEESWRQMLSVSSMGVTGIHETVTATWILLRDWLLPFWEALRAIYDRRMLDMLAITRQVNQWIYQEVQRTWPMIYNEVVNNASAMSTETVALVQGMATAVEAAMSGMAAAARASGQALGNAFADGIRSTIGAVTAAAQAVAAAARQFLPSSDAKKGPLSDLSKTGPALVHMFAKGIWASRPALAAAMSETMAYASRPFEVAKVAPWDMPKTTPWDAAKPRPLPYASRPFEVAKPAPWDAPKTAPWDAPKITPLPDMGARPAQGSEKCITINIYNPVGQPAERDVMRALKNLSALGVMEAV